MFDKKAIKDLPIYGIRGNHGSRFADQNLWTNLTKRWDQWKMPNLYYTTEFVVDEVHGYKMAMLHIDSNFLMCASFKKATDKEVKLLDHRTKKIMETHCFDKAGTYNKTGLEMIDWIKSTAKTQAKDTKVIWRAAVLHHPMFSLYYDDYVKLVESFLPLLRTYGYDFYFAGMEHQLNYANFPLDEPGNGRTGRKIDENIDSNSNCHKRSEFWIRKGPEAKSHTVIATQGEFVHQVTVGASGKTTYPICEWNMQMSHGNFVYGESKYNGYALVHVTKGKVDVKLMGVEHFTGLPPKSNSTE